MTKERVEELIKQCGTVYKIDYGKVWKMSLINDEKNHCDISRDKFLHFHELLEFNDSFDNRWTDYYVGLDELFESKEQAEWVCKNHAERTERFEPPMWEDIEDEYEFYFTCQDYKSKSSNPCGMFVVNKKGTLKNYILVRNVSHYPNIFTFDAPATKENYEKACEIVRDLFKGESNGKNAQEK